MTGLRCNCLPCSYTRCGLLLHLVLTAPCCLSHLATLGPCSLHDKTYALELTGFEVSVMRPCRLSTQKDGWTPKRRPKTPRPRPRRTETSRCTACGVLGGPLSSSQRSSLPQVHLHSPLSPLHSAHLTSSLHPQITWAAACHTLLLLPVTLSWAHGLAHGL